MKKSIWIFLFIAALLILLPIGAFADEPGGSLNQVITFEDVPEHAWYAGYVSDACIYGLFQGVGNQHFEPNQPINRGSFVTVLGRMYEQTGVIIIDADDTFSDTVKSSYYSKYVAWAVDEGIIEGYGNNTFGPADPVTKEQMAVILSRYIAFTEEELEANPGIIYLEFSDLGAISSWAGAAVSEMQSYGIVTGDENNYYQPQKAATRAEAATVFARLYRQIFDPVTFS